MKLTDEQRKEVIDILNEMYSNIKQNRERLSQLKDWYEESIDKYFDETLNDIQNFIDTIKNNKDYEYSKDFLIFGLLHEIVKTKNKDTLCKLNSNFAGFGSSF